MAKVTIPTSGLWSAIAGLFNSMFDEIYGRTGWAYYADNQYTSGAPLAVLADTDTSLPNNAATVIESQKPTDITTFYDGTVITGRDGDDIIISIDFTIEPTNVGTTLIEVWLDITGGTGTPASLANLYRREFGFAKGVGVARKVSFSHSGYTLNTWATNGAVVKIRTNGTADIYDIGYILKRTHKAR